MRRNALLLAVSPFLAAALHWGCGGGSGNCPAGYEGCPCTLGESACGAGLNCVDGTCVTPTSNAGSGGGGSLNLEECNICIDSSCSSEHSACQSDADCTDLAACYFGCFSTSDITSCATNCATEAQGAAVDSLQTMSELWACVSQSCVQECFTLPNQGTGTGGTNGDGSGAGGTNGDGNGGTGGDPSGVTSLLGTGVMTGSGQSSDRMQKADVMRNETNYVFIANGWGPGLDSQTVSWNGTAFTVLSMNGSQGANFEPASSPTVFCGLYSDSQSGPCGLPAAITSPARLQTGWRWQPNGNTGQYNAAYDIWLGNGPDIGSFSGYLMVWLRNPPGQQPPGRNQLLQATVANVPGTWSIWTGQVAARPIISWVRAEGNDSHELEFDVLDFIRDAQDRNLQVPGTHILGVAVGFQIWNGPVNNLESVDFYVDVN